MAIPCIPLSPHNNLTVWKGDSDGSFADDLNTYCTPYRNSLKKQKPCTAPITKTSI